MSTTPFWVTATGTEARVIADIECRQIDGILKYGTTVDENPIPLRAWLQHAYEESLDKAIYLRRAIEEMDRAANTSDDPPDPSDPSDSSDRSTP
jgi:hypothetical protein